MPSVESDRAVMTRASIVFVFGGISCLLGSAIVATAVHSEPIHDEAGTSTTRPGEVAAEPAETSEADRRRLRWERTWGLALPDGALLDEAFPMSAILPLGDPTQPDTDWVYFVSRGEQRELVHSLLWELAGAMYLPRNVDRIFVGTVTPGSWADRRGFAFRQCLLAINNVPLPDRYALIDYLRANDDLPRYVLTIATGEYESRRVFYTQPPAGDPLAIDTIDSAQWEGFWGQPLTSHMTIDPAWPYSAVERPYGSRSPWRYYIGPAERQMLHDRYAELLEESVAQNDEGLWFRAVPPGGYLASRGFQTGDRIRSLNGTPVREGEDLAMWIRHYASIDGRQIAVEIERNGEALRRDFVLSPLPE